jgi:hypothetical protein
MMGAGSTAMFTETPSAIPALRGIANWWGTAIRRRRPVNFVLVGVYVAVVPFEVGLVGTRRAGVCLGIGEKEECSGDGCNWSVHVGLLSLWISLP